MTRCAVWDCTGAATAGSRYCWAHTELRRRGLLRDDPHEGRAPPGPPSALPPPPPGDPPRECREWDCDRRAVPGSNYCSTHRRR